MPNIEYYQTFYQCFSDQTRLRIVSLMLRFKQVCTIDLEWALDITQAKSSRHLRVMDHARLVKRERMDNWVFYSVKPEMQAMVEALMRPMLQDPVLEKDAEHYRNMLINRELAASRLYLKSIVSIPSGQ